MTRRFDTEGVMASLTGRLAHRPPAISPASLADAPALAALHAAAFRRGWSADEFERFLDEPNVVADHAIAGELVGYVLSRKAADQAEILSIAVAEAFRGRGIAGKLLDVHLRRLAYHGVYSVFLEVDERNLPARRLYASFRFGEVGRRPNYYCDPGEPAGTALVLRRDL